MPDPTTPPADGADNAAADAPDLEQLQRHLEQQQEQLATAEAQRDELQVQLTVTENRHALQQALAAAGATDVDLAMTALRQRLDLDEPLTTETVASAVEQLMLDKPLLAAQPTTATMPPATSGPHDQRPAGTAQLSQAARQAATTGNRKDIAEYLRLRRQAARR
jgi:hypothetical protein